YRELAAMVSRLKARYHIWEISEVTSFMRNNDILTKDEVFTPDKTASRIDGPVYIIRALGFREIAELDNIYNCTFKDADKIPTEKTGYAAIAYGLKIISGDENGCFNPNDKLTRADAAIMIYNYLAR
ncbi:MAG: S-layer homology domain-containing protein, partial [Clostridia bacterium]|nr:S-layer homology domain-containing protein [Clostridia bacterium]